MANEYKEIIELSKEVAKLAQEDDEDVASDVAELEAAARTLVEDDRKNSDYVS